MLQQSDADREDIQIAAHMRDFVESEAYKILDPLLKDAVSTLKLRREQSDDPNIVMSCVKKEDGIMFIYEVINELITRGDDAIKQSA